MITAAEALQLPTAQMTAEESEAVDKLMALIEKSIRESMQHYGIDLTVGTPHRTVVNEVNHRLVLAGWTTEWQPITEKSRFANAETIKGFRLSLAPSKDSREEAARLRLQ